MHFFSPYYPKFQTRWNLFNLYLVKRWLEYLPQKSRWTWSCYCCFHCASIFNNVSNSSIVKYLRFRGDEFLLRIVVKFDKSRSCSYTQQYPDFFTRFFPFCFFTFTIGRWSSSLILATINVLAPHNHSQMAHLWKQSFMMNQKWFKGVSMITDRRTVNRRVDSV